ncbi:CapA family protein [Candidatus Poribacteria bacterium]
MEKKTLRLAAVGDIMLADLTHYLGIGIGSKLRANSGFDVFEFVGDILRESDLAIGNLEAPLSKTTIHQGFAALEMRGEPEWADFLAAAGFSVLSVANNHTFQHGMDAWENTVRALRERSIRVIGIKGEQPIVVECKGIEIALLEYSLRPRQYLRQEESPNAIATLEDLESIEAEVRKASALGEIVVVSLHWGKDYTRRPSVRQVQFAHSLIDAGATVIIGHHPHVLQGVEFGSNFAIAYSLGNFVFDMCQKRARQSAILCADVGKNSVRSELVPVYIDTDGRPHPVDGEQSESLLRTIDQLNSMIPSTEIPIETDEVSFSMEVERSLKEFRRKSMAWFVRSWYRYPPRCLKYILLRGVKKHLARIARMGRTAT